ncbi:MAG: hypothetical protein ABI693_16775 [Bryobacteraceae bacterium]
MILVNGVTAGDVGGLGPIKVILPRIGQLRTGSQFVAYIASMDARRREQAILNEVLGGNVPDFLRKLVPVKLEYQSAAGQTHSATVFVMPEYLAIGSSDDFVRIPMNFHTAAAVASALGFVLPTRKIVNAIYHEAAVHFVPEPMAAGPQMRSTEYYRIHNQKIEAQSRMLGVTPGALVSGDKKDVVITKRLISNPGKIAIYGWHRQNGAPIQPLSTVHGACYADYSHGIRLVSETAIVDGQEKSIYDLLKDPQLADVLSDDGPIPNLRELMTGMANNTSCGPPAS